MGIVSQISSETLWKLAGMPIGSFALIIYDMSTQTVHSKLYFRVALFIIIILSSTLGKLLGRTLDKRRAVK